MKKPFEQKNTLQLLVQLELIHWYRYVVRGHRPLNLHMMADSANAWDWSSSDGWEISMEGISSILSTRKGLGASGGLSWLFVRGLHPYRRRQGPRRFAPMLHLSSVRIAQLEHLFQYCNETEANGLPVAYLRKAV